jgi:hypothetical protein
MVLLALPGSLDLEVKTGSAAARAPQRWLIGVRPQACFKADCDLPEDDWFRWERVRCGSSLGPAGRRSTQVCYPIDYAAWDDRRSREQHSRCSAGQHLTGRHFVRCCAACLVRLRAILAGLCEGRPVHISRRHRHGTHTHRHRHRQSDKEGDHHAYDTGPHGAQLLPPQFRFKGSVRKTVAATVSQHPSRLGFWRDDDPGSLPS